MNKTLITSVLTAAMILGSASSVFACTGTYVGKKVSANGSTLVARTEDLDSHHPKSMIVYPAADHKKGSMYRSAITNFEYPNPLHTYKYFAVPDSDGDKDDGTYDEVGYNENGVAITATISADVNDKIQSVDPLVEDGLREADIASLVLSRAKTAREGVELLAKIVDEKGSAEGNIVMIADHNEVWYMEIVSGHQYAATKMPDDMVAVIPNTFLLDNVNVNDKANVIASKNLISMPEKNHLLKTYNGEFSVRKTYGTPVQNYDRDRLWGGRHFLAPSKKTPFNSDFTLYFKPDKKVSVKDVMELQKYRYEDTKLNANLPENNTEKNKVRPIGTPNSHECHIIELKDNFPKEAPGLLWLCMGNAEHNVYLPYFPLVNKVQKEYSNRYHDFNENQAYWAFRGQATLAELNRDKYGKNVRKYWEQYQDKIIKDQDAKNAEFLKIYHLNGKSNATNYANQEANKLQKESYDKAVKMYHELFRYVAGEAGRPAKDAFTPSEMQQAK